MSHLSCKELEILKQDMVASLKVPGIRIPVKSCILYLIIHTGRVLNVPSKKVNRHTEMDVIHTFWRRGNVEILLKSSYR